MTDNLNNSREETQQSFDDDPQTPRRGNAGTSDTDDEDVLQNNPDVMKRDDLEGLDLDADMEEEDDDLDLDTEDDASAGDDTEAIP